MIIPPKKFETSRLCFRVPALSDAHQIFGQYARDDDVARYMSWKPHKNISDTENFIRRCIATWEKAAAFPWVLTRKEDNQLIGMIQLRINGTRADMGYVLSKTYWGNGYTTEAVKAVVDWALSQDQVFRVWAVCDIDNLSSARVLEKAGLQMEGILRRWIIHPNISSEPRDCLCYSIVK